MLGPPFLPVGAQRRPPGREHSQDTKVSKELSHSPGDVLLHHSASRCFRATLGKAAFSRLHGGVHFWLEPAPPPRWSVLCIKQPLQMKEPFASKWHKLLFLYCSHNRGCPEIGMKGSQFAVFSCFPRLAQFS